jgi:hypothetical protein
MKLGVMVTTDRHAGQIQALVLAALAQGHAATIFATDTGTRLLADPRFVGLSALPGVRMSYCALSAERHGVPAGLPESVVAGSQFDNALMAADVDKLLLL